MRFNIFAGARRVAVLLAVVVALAVVALAVAESDQRVSLRYNVARPDAPFVRTEQACPNNGSDPHRIETEIESGKKIDVYLCLLTAPFSVPAPPPGFIIEGQAGLHTELNANRSGPWVRYQQEDRLIGSALSEAHAAGNANEARRLAQAYEERRRVVGQNLAHETVPQNENFFDQFDEVIDPAKVEWDDETAPVSGTISLIPYGFNRSGELLGAEARSTEVAEYKNQLSQNFSLPESDRKWVSREFSKKRGKLVLKAAVYLAATMLAFWTVVWAIGWVVRGFFGIPLGKDNRPT